MTSRRRYLAALASLPLAGCVSGLEDVDGATPTDGRTGESTPTPTPVATPTAAGGGTASETPTDDQASGEGPTPTDNREPGEDPTPTDDQGQEEDPTPTESTDVETPESVDAAWPMPDYDQGRSNYAPASTGPTGAIGQLWETSTDATLSGPVVAEGRVYVGGTSGDVWALDARTGEQEWRVSVGGAAGTPWVVDGDLYLPAGDDVVALAAADGTERWRVAAPDRAGFLAASHGIYYLVDAEEPQVVGRDRTDGSERWRTDVDRPWSPRLFADDAFVFVSSGPGSPVPWILDVDAGDLVGDEPTAGADFPEERFLHDGHVYAVESFFGSIEATTVTDDGVRTDWRESFAGYAECPAAAGADDVYCYAEGGEPGLYAFDRSDGALQWHAPGPDQVDDRGRPVVTDEAILVPTDGALRCYDPADGSELWSHPRDGIGAQFVVADDLLFTTAGGSVRAFRSA